MVDKPGYITPPPGLIPDRPDEQTETVRRTERKPLLPTFVPQGTPQSPPVRAPQNPPSGAPHSPSSEAPVETTVTATTQSPGQWSLTMHDGSVIHITGTMLLGRDPAPVDPWASASLVRVNDPEKTVSKTHVALEAASNMLQVIDVHSTNGTAVVTPDGSESVLTPGQAAVVPDGGILVLGRYRIQVSRRQ